MLAPSRRIFLYWLLLLLPTLAVGAGALYLLKKEQARLDEQAKAATSLRREAIAARARQIAENVELLLGDVQAGLMTTLMQTTGENPEAWLDAWGGNNPLVKSTFRLAADGRILRPANGEAQRQMRLGLVEAAEAQQILALPAVGAPDFGQKLIDFMAATPGPAPYLILEKPAKPQYPWGTATPTPRKDRRCRYRVACRNRAVFRSHHRSLRRRPDSGAPAAVARRTWSCR